MTPYVTVTWNRILSKFWNATVSVPTVDIILVQGSKGRGKSNTQCIIEVPKPQQFVGYSGNHRATEEGLKSPRRSIFTTRTSLLDRLACTATKMESFVDYVYWIFHRLVGTTITTTSTTNTTWCIIKFYKFSWYLSLNMASATVVNFNIIYLYALLKFQDLSLITRCICKSQSNKIVTSVM